MRRALHRSGIWPDLETARWETAERIANNRVRHWSFQLEKQTSRRAAEMRGEPPAQPRRTPGERHPEITIEREWDHDRSLTVSRRMTMSR
jgi:hypothetical protein